MGKPGVSAKVQLDDRPDTLNQHIADVVRADLVKHPVVEDTASDIDFGNLLTARSPRQWPEISALGHDGS